MAKKQKSFADKASGRGGDADATMVKYVTVSYTHLRAHET